jgi:hypothetical protein
MNLESFFQSVVGRMAQGVRPNDPVSRMYAVMLRRYAEHALSQWSAISASGLRCAILTRNDNPMRGPAGQVACTMPAAGPCIACGNLVCLRHALASADDGSLFCKACVQHHTGAGFADPEPGPGPGAAADSEPEPPGTQEVLREQYLDRLGLPPTATLADVKRQFKQLSRKFHPDVLRREPPARRAQLEARYKGMTQAYHWLIEHYAEAA